MQVSLFANFAFSSLKSSYVCTERLAILCITVALSFLSLTKTGFNVNVPDPDENRKNKQYPQNVPRFWLTSIPFHFVCVLFRVTCLAYFFANLSHWTFAIIAFTFIINMLILHYDAQATPTMTIVLGLVSIFMPNGYLLYNFAATFAVNWSFSGTKKFLFFHMLSVTAEFCICVAVIWAGQVNEWSFVTKNIPENSVLNTEDVKEGANGILLGLGVLSVLLAFIHWKASIEPLYKTPEESDQEKDIQMQEQ